MVIMLGMLVIILTGIRFAADIIVPFIGAFLAVIINPLVQLLVRCRVPRVLAISLLIGLIVMLAIVLLASGTSLNELARTLPQYRNYLYEPMQTIAPRLQRMGFTVSVVELNKYIDPNAVMTGHQPAHSAVERHVLHFSAAADGGVYAAGGAAASR